MPGALDGVRVLDLSTLVQGPQAGAMLHDLGAEVIKIELPEVGDVGRHVGHMDGVPHTSVFIACNRGKKSVTLDLRTEGGKTAFLKLVETADVMLSNFQPGTLEALILVDLVPRMNPNGVSRIREFMQKANQETPSEVTIPDEETRILRAKLIVEEALETVRALGVDVQLGDSGYSISDKDSDLRFTAAGHSIQQVSMKTIPGSQHTFHRGLLIRCQNWSGPDTGLQRTGGSGNRPTLLQQPL